MSRSFESTSLTLRPSIVTTPPLISSSPASIRSSVDLPQPDGPTSTRNSPSLISNVMPWMTLVAPKFFSTFSNATVAMKGSACMKGVRARASGLDGARGEPAYHVALARVVHHRRRQRIQQPCGHQQLPRRIVGRQEVAEADRQRDVGVIGQQQERVQIFVPRQQ